MYINFKELSYGNLISHTFPGLLVLFEIIIAFKLFTPYDGFKYLLLIDFKILNIIALFIVIYVFSTILGVVIDGVHHFIFRKKEKWDEEFDYEIYKVVRTIDQLQIYNKLVNDDMWYYYECYANISISMLPGGFLIPYWLFILNINLWFILIIIAIYILIVIICFLEAISCLDRCNKIEDALIRNFSKEKDINKSG